ncbi:aquaporin [Demequina sp. NBRC 110054]|uniref:aquaporin n=1 Tax=Demequina sp. NBRC 110054 TaxID=1570343 RepID=UPI000A001141|nr:aquaporin [Demequina sp. NBRC 110054]
MSEPEMDKPQTSPVFDDAGGDAARMSPPAEAPPVDDAPGNVAAARDPQGPSLVSRMAAEAVGTFILVFMGVGAALFSGVLGWDTIAVPFGFALGVMIAALIFGGVSGAHLNPAVTFGVWLSGRLPGRDVAPYMVSQVIGAAASAGLFALLISTNSLYDTLGTTREVIGSASNGYGEHSPTEFGVLAGGIIEIVIAALLVAVVLSVTSVRNETGPIVAPFAIGLTVGFLVLIAIPFTNGALNPARATGTAIWSESWAIQQVWLFWVAPLIGAAISGVLFRAFGPKEDLLAYADMVDELDGAAMEGSAVAFTRVEVIETTELRD